MRALGTLLCVVAFAFFAFAFDAFVKERAARQRDDVAQGDWAEKRGGRFKAGYLMGSSGVLLFLLGSGVQRIPVVTCERCGWRGTLDCWSSAAGCPRCRCPFYQE